MGRKPKVRGENSNVLEFPNQMNEPEFLFKCTVQFYWIDPATKQLKNSKDIEDIPKGIKELNKYVVETRETLNADEFLFTMAHAGCIDKVSYLIFNQDETGINDRKALAKGFLRLSGFQLGDYTKEILTKLWGEEKFKEFYGTSS